jgi:hypothetical protein
MSTIPQRRKQIFLTPFLSVKFHVLKFPTDVHIVISQGTVGQEYRFLQDFRHFFHVANVLKVPQSDALCPTSQISHMHWLPLCGTNIMAQRLPHVPALKRGGYCGSQRGPHQVPGGPQQNDRKLGGHSNYWEGHWLKYFIFKTESMVPFSVASPQHRRQCRVSLLFSHRIWLNLVSVWRLICCQKNLNIFKFWREMVFACNWPQCNRTFTNLQNYSSDPMNTLNIMPIICRTFLLVRVNKVLCINKYFKKAIL